MDDWQPLFYLVPYLLSLAISTGVGAYTWRRRAVVGAGPYAVLALAQASWTLGYVLELASPSLEAKVFWDNTQFVGMLVVPVAFLIFALQYTGHELKHPRRTWGLLAIVPALSWLLIFTDRFHGLVRRGVWLIPGEPFPELTYDFTLTFWLMTAYAYALTFVSLFLLLGRLVRSLPLYRAQVATILVGISVPWAGTVLTVLEVAPTFHRDMSPLTFALGNLVVAWGLFRYRLFDVVPVARDTVIENMSAAVVVLDAQDRVVDLNPAARRAIAPPAAGVIGQPAARAFADWPKVVERFQGVEVLRTEISLQVEGERRHFEVNLSPLHDQRGRQIGRLIVIHNITERVRAEFQRKAALEALRQAHDELDRRVHERTAELHAANEQLRSEIAERQQAEETLQKRTTQLEALRQVGLEITAQLDLEVLLHSIVSRAVELLEGTIGALYLYQPDQDVLNIEVAVGITPSIVGTVLRPGEGLAGKVWERGEPIIVHDYRRWEGRTTNYDDHNFQATVGVPVRWGGQSLGVLSVLADATNIFSPADAELLSLFATQAAIAIENARLYATEQQRAAALARALEQQRELDRLKTEFMQNVSHELRTPLAMILGYVDLLSSGELGEVQAAQQEPLDTTLQQAHVLNDLVESITTILENEAREPAREPVSLAGLAAEAVADLQVLAARSRLVLHSDLAEQVPPVLGDADQLRRIVDNLIGNALKFTPDGGTVTVSLHRAGDEAILRVADTGIGIPAGHLERIFDRFYQVNGTTRRRYGGSGLGLALVKEIVERHGGRIEVESEVGQGSTFTIRLKAIEESSARSSAEPMAGDF